MERAIAILWFNNYLRGFPGGQMVKTPSYYCRGNRFNP